MKMDEIFETYEGAQTWYGKVAFWHDVTASLKLMRLKWLCSSLTALIGQRHIWTTAEAFWQHF